MGRWAVGQAGRRAGGQVAAEGWDSQLARASLLRCRAAILCDAYRTSTPTEARAMVLSTAHGVEPPVPQRPRSSALKPATLMMRSKEDSEM